MRRNTFNQYISRGDFKGLFISELGWNQVHGTNQLPTVSVDGENYSFSLTAVRNGFHIIDCSVNEIPSPSICKKIDIKLRRVAFDYICIYHIPQTTHHSWIATITKLGKRSLAYIEYETITQTNLLFTKINDLAFDIDQVSTIRDVKDKVNAAFAINSEKITKDFYRGFKNVLGNFAKHIIGMEDATPVTDNRWKQWYASIMLNRLMFCYFIQKKGFLDGNLNYLREKLEWVRFEKGLNRFYDSFYKGFLVALFHEGLNSPVRDEKFKQLYGQIPFINGGMFASHMIEEKYPDMDIDDDAFMELFAFFDTWEWHLDTRLSSSGKDINPDVLGYIFEQYINDKCKMGAFYTQEDITEYISKNCIIPHVFKCAFNDTYSDYSNSIIQSSPLDYIYESTKTGYSSDWANLIPDNISSALNDATRRSESWNERTSVGFSLPRETWRDTIARLRRCDDIISTITTEGIHSIEDLVTLNIDIRKFARDIIAYSESSTFIKDIYQSIREIKVLDPACGSGAFLFAAMNVLEPLYEECINRMRLIHESDSSLFADELAEIDSSSNGNIDFQICSIIALHNIYGVDIMPEAIETAKLRLFLRMVSSLEINKRAENLGLDPLPDIDFNLLCGNSLVGSSTIDQCSEYVAQLGEVKSMVDRYKELQIRGDRSDDTHSLKEEIIRKYRQIDKSINRQLLNSTEEYSWIDGKAPLNWSARFFHIIQDGGFDVIIGNPPYRENRLLDYSVAQYETSDCGNVYTCMMERGFSILKRSGYLGMIVQLPIVCTDRMLSAQRMISGRNTWLLNFDDRPGKLFENIEHIRVTIVISKNEPGEIYTSRYNRWYTETRQNLFNGLTMVPGYQIPNLVTIPKIGDAISTSIMQKICRFSPLSRIEGDTNSILYYHNAPLYFTRGTNFLPYFKNQGGVTISSSVKKMSFIDDAARDVCACVLNSTLFYMWYVYLSDCRHLNVREIESFPLGYESMSTEVRDQLVAICSELMLDLQNNKIRKITNGQRNGFNEYDEFKPKPSKPLFDRIDTLLAAHFNLTAEELDYIINYDYKFRMGDSQDE